MTDEKTKEADPEFDTFRVETKITAEQEGDRITMRLESPDMRHPVVICQVAASMWGNEDFKKTILSACDEYVNFVMQRVAVESGGTVESHRTENTDPETKL